MYTGHAKNKFATQDWFNKMKVKKKVTAYPYEITKLTTPTPKCSTIR